FEADVAARFTVLEDRTQSEMLERATLGVVLEAAGVPDSALGRALAVVVAGAADTTIRDVVREAIGKREQLLRWINAAGGSERAMAQLSAVLGIAADDNLAQVANEIVEGPHFPSSRWADVAARCRQGSKNDKAQGARFSAALVASGVERL